MAEVLLRLQRPASLTPELRAWISQRTGAVLTRARGEGSDRSLLLRVELENDAEEGLIDLMTDLRLLGLHPTLLAEQAA